jgi:hypothetical protein
MLFSAVSETLSDVKDLERCCLLIASIMRREREIICTTCGGAAARYSLAWDSWFSKSPNSSDP